jgi:hypothetical protein
MVDNADSNEKTQSGWQVALGVLAFIFGTIAIALILKAIFF